ncbi:hypothetical protein V491_03396, partial [Pseudogymnoascus sp. VKM F-3775]
MYTSNLYKDFVEYYAVSRHGRIRESPTVDSVLNIWFRFSGYQSHTTKSKIDKNIVSDVTGFIEGPLIQKYDLYTKKHDKFLVTEKDLEILMTHLWCSDDHNYLHERYRVQLSFGLICFSKTGARAGAIVESSLYRGTNEAIAYKEASGGFSWQLELIQRYIKGRHDNENDNIHVILNSENDLQYNGIMFFFAIAAADKALKGYETLDDLMRARLPRGRDSWTLEWKDDTCERPVLRMAYASGVYETRALTFAALQDQIVSLGKCIGYRDNMKVHAIRANVANNVKDPETCNQVLGHRSTDIHNRHYTSKIIDVSDYIPGTSSTKNIEMLC